MRLNNENCSLKERIDILQGNEQRLLHQIHERTIDDLKKENHELKDRINVLEKENVNPRDRISLIEANDQRREAIFKLHECDSLSNKAFRKEYIKYFNLSKYSKDIPNISDFILNPPDKIDDSGNYNFWQQFILKYPGSDNSNFNLIYKRINCGRMNFECSRYF